MTTETTTHLVANTAITSRATYPKWILMAASACTLGAGLIVLAGFIALLMPGAGSLPTLLRGNWLITIVRLLAGDAAIQASELYRLNALDLVLLALTAVTQAGLYCTVRRNHQVLALLALVQPPLGILLFLLTHSAGRSAVMGATLAMPVAMLGSQNFGKWTARMGLLASILLLLGDFGAGLAPNSMLAVATGIGYMLLTCWLFVVGRRLLQPGTARTSGAARELSR